MPALLSLDPNKSLTQFVLDDWGDENGLPHGNITSITQTPDGYLWLATAGGLMRFDGVRFVAYNFENTPVFQSNVLRTLLTAADSSLWIATDQSGLVRWKNGQFTALTTAEGLASNCVWSVCAGADGAIWIHVPQGLHRWQAGKLDSFALPDSIARIRSQALCVDQAGYVWLAINQKVFRWRPAEQQPPAPLLGEGGSRVLCLLADRTGAVWIGTYDAGLIRYDEGRISTYTTAAGLAHDRVWGIYEDRAGTIWVATEQGLSRWRHGRFDSFSGTQGLPDGRCRSLYEDREGCLWVGSYSRLYRFKTGRVTMLGKSEGLSPGPARCVFQDSAGSIWIGSNSGLNRLQRENITTFTTADGLPCNNVFAVGADERGTLWVGTEVGLARFDGRRFHSPPAAPERSKIRVIYDDTVGHLWAGTLDGHVSTYANGVFRLWRPDLHDGDCIYWFHRDRAGNFWIGKWGSLLHVKSGASLHTGPVESENLDTRCCYEEADGTLWLGTLGNGVIRRKEGVSRNFTTKQGLFDNYIWAILEDDAGYLWMSSDRGIWQVHKNDFADLETGRIVKLTCVAYGRSEGLRFKEGNAMGFPKSWKDRAGRLWFPTIKGVAIVDPQQQIINPLPPPVHIEEVLVDTVAVVWRDQLQLSPNSKNISITYTATSLRQPQNVQFRYRLEGYDAGWIEAGTRRTAYYTNLAPGDYRFRVVACNENNVWNNAGASLRFAIAPHFHQTGWFAVLAGLVLSLMVYGGYRWRLHHLEVKQARLEQLISEQTAQLRASDAKNKAILQALPDAIFRLSCQRTILEFFAAPHFKTCTSPQEFLGKKISEVLPPPIARMITRAIDRARQSGQMQVVDYELSTAGEVLHFEAYLVSIESEETLAIVRDITARKLAEKTLREFEAFRLIAEASPIAMTVTRWSDGAILFANQHAAHLLAVPREKMTALHSLSWYDDPQERTKLLEIIARAGSIHNQEVKLRRPDGTSFWVLASCQRLEFNGEPALLSGYYDISARKQAEREIRRLNEELEQRVAARTRALQESETKFRTLAEMATAGIFIFRGEQVCYVNPAAERITGYSNQELLQMNFRHLLHPGFHIASPAHSNGGLPQARHELRIIAKDSNAKWIDFTTSPIDYQGEAAVLGTALDITDRKRLEEQLHDYMEDLERLVEQRTVRIKELERQRIETEKLAATGRMAARIAHEINNPLGIIQTACQLVSRAVPPGHRHSHHLGTIHKEIDRIAQIVRQMLDLHRPHREAPRAFHVAETIGEIVALMKPKARESRVQLQLDVVHTGAPVTLPENQLRQVLYNLLLNAVEASPAGGEVRVRVEIAADRMLLAVRDQGAGIPQEIGSRVFEPFFTTKNKSATGGLGLGLAICKSLVESMNGVITFDSRSGQGTTFRVSVPLPSRGETHERIGPDTDCR